MEYVCAVLLLLVVFVNVSDGDSAVVGVCGWPTPVAVGRLFVGWAIRTRGGRARGQWKIRPEIVRRA